MYEIRVFCLVIYSASMRLERSEIKENEAYGVNELVAGPEMRENES